MREAAGPAGSPPAAATPLVGLPLGVLGDWRAGTVVTFAEGTGLGQIEQHGGVEDGRRWPFHCVALTDGSRHVDLHAAVRFQLAAAPAGGLEARRVLPV